MPNIMKKFRKDESGAVTVDWVVLTAAIVAFNIGAILNMFQGALNEAATYISESAANAGD